MKPAGQKAISLLYSNQAVRFVFLFLITGMITTGLSNSMTTKEDDARLTIFKDGDVMIGGFASQHKYRCETFSPSNLGSVEAYIYAIEEINKDKALLPNLTLGYDIRDTCGSEIITARQAFKFATASTMNCKAVRCRSSHKCFCDVNGTSSKNYSSTYPVIAIVGALPSRIAIPLANFLQAVRIPYVESSASSEELSSSVNDSFFRTIPSDANQAKAFADIIEHFGWRYVAVVGVDDSYGRHGVLALERESIKRRTFCVELFAYIPLEDYNNKLKMLVSSLRLRKTVKVIIVWSGSLYVKKILILAVKEGLKNRVWIFSESVAGEAPEYLSSIHNLSSTGIHIGVKVQSKVPEHFRAHLQNRLLRNHSKQEPYLWQQFWEYVALTNLSHKSSSELLDMTYDDYAIFMIDAVYSVANALDRMLRCKRAKNSASINKNLCPDNKQPLNAGQLVEYLKTVEFKGVTGKVQFDSTGDPLEAIYDIVYFKISKINGNERVTKDVIGQWSKKSNNDSIHIDDEIQWKNEDDERKIPSSTCTEECEPGQWKVPTTECCWKCLSCIDGSVSKTRGALNCTKCTERQKSNYKQTHCIPLPITNIDWSDILAIILTIFSILGIVIDVCVFGILFYFRETPMVKALNKVCTLVLLLGIALCFGMTLLYIVRPSSGLCSFLQPLRYVVYTLCCSALFLKTMQIVHAFNISQLKIWVKAFICSTKRQVIVLLVMICIEVLLGAGWILLDPPYAHVTIVPKSHVFITCVAFKGTPGKVFDSLMLVYLVLVAGCCIYYAFRARNLPANFNEAKHISFSLYIFLLSWITYYPIDYAAEGWYVAVLSGATLLLSSYGLLGCIFGPKLFIIVLHPEKNTMEFIRNEMRDNHVRQSGNNSSSVRPVETLT